MERKICRPRVFTLLLVGSVFVSSAYGQGVCPEKGKTVIVRTEESRLSLCEDGKAVRSYRVALGRGGTGKRSHKDHKTPLGSYALAAPRNSQRFHLFIPIGFPTKDQIKKGYTGQDIGLHSQDRLFTWAGSLNTWFNWTDGCVAVGSDPEIDEVAAWVRRTGANTITIQ